MRKNIVAGNWKMNTTLQEGVALAKKVNELVKGDEKAYVILGCPFIHMTEVVHTIDSSKIGVSAQNCSSEKNGAYTGEISAEMIKSTGAGYVIIGHSERRAYYSETDETLKQKVDRAIEQNLHVIFCCGEVLKERENKNHFSIVKQQLEKTIFQLDEEKFSRIIIAYEPVWAIGTGLTATPEQAQEMHLYIRNLIKTRYSAPVAENTSILYGGSCKPSNAKSLFSNPDVDGGLIGGASLNARDFYDIVTAF